MKKFSTTRKRNFRLYQIAGIALLCISLIIATYSFSLAWFRDESVTSNSPNIAIIGTIGLDVTTNFNFKNLVLAPDTTYTVDRDNQDIGTYIKTSSAHNIDGAFVRVRYEYERDLEPGEDPSFIPDELTLYFNDGKITESSTYSDSDEGKWAYVGSGEAGDPGYYYYIGIVRNANIIFNAGYTVNNKLYNTIKGDPVQITLTFEAIQWQYGAYHDWDSVSPQVFKGYAAKVSNH